MKKIEILSQQIEKEIDNAYEYARCALDTKESDPVIAELYYKIASNKLNDMGLLHGQVVAIINDYRKDHGEPPEAMKMLYNILHKKHIESAASVKGMLALYKEP